MANVIPLDGDWLLAPDPKNIGRDQNWFHAPVAEAKQTRVPWIIQGPFPGYHGVAWYWREFDAPANAHPQGRYLLRFWAVDYKAHAWLNDQFVGTHEGGETPFVLDVTDSIKPNASNRLAVRVLNPTHERIDGIVLNETPHINKVIPYSAGASFDFGGIVDSVELLMAPAIRVEDLFARADPKTGTIGLQVNLRNVMPQLVRARLEVAVAPAASGQTLQTAVVECDLPAGDTLVQTALHLDHPRLWELDDPFLYRVTARVAAAQSDSVDERSVRCGFREFRFENGCFRLNGRRLFLRCSHTGNECPVGLTLPVDPDWLRRDLVNVKAMGFNSIRFISMMGKRSQLDFCDELGLLVYEETQASWCLADSPQMGARFDRSFREMILRDRNHPSVVIWGLLNETNDGPVFRHAVTMLPLMRALDDTRLILLSSGRWDLYPTCQKPNPPIEDKFGTLCNPGRTQWENVLDDQHTYPRVPHTAGIIHELRTVSGAAGQPLFISEYGIGSGVDLIRVARHYEQLGATGAEDARFYRGQLDRFLVDWARWKMADAFGRPEDFFEASNRKMAGQRLLGLNALRANTHLVAHSVTGTVDQGRSGEGLATTFREPKPGTMDAMFQGWAPLRLCLFAEPVNVYRGARVRLDAVLANEDVLGPGEYPVRLQVAGPGPSVVWERTVTVTIPAGEPPLAIPIFSEDVAVDGPAGAYRFLASFERDGAPMGGVAEFYLDDPAAMPAVQTQVVLWGEDAPLAKWLTAQGIRHRPFTADLPPARQVILVSRTPGDSFADLARHIGRGATAVFLDPQVFKKGDQAAGFVPLVHKGNLAGMRGWLYHKDEWAKPHPVFDGLPVGMLDYTFYRDIIPDLAWRDQDAPADVVAGANDVSWNYSSGLLLAIYHLGAGRFILNTLLIRETLGTHPVAERLLRNLLREAAREAGKSLVELPPNFDAQLKAIGYL